MPFHNPGDPYSPAPGPTPDSPFSGFRPMGVDVGFDVVRYQTQEIERLRLLLVAERAENKRLHAAVSLLKDGCGVAVGVLEAAHAEANENSAYLHPTSLENCLERVDTAVKEADKLLAPLAQETPETV